MSNSLQPSLNKERIQSLDILRGIAVLGILIMNIQSFAMPGSAYINPTSYGNLEGVNYWVWVVSHIFADQKFMTIFSVLFGAGVILVSDKVEKRGLKPSIYHYKRTFWLFLIGLIHAYVIWYGDILMTYAVCSCFVYFFRKLSPLKLLIFGLLILSIHSIIYLFFGYSLEFMPEESLKELKYSFWNPNSESITNEMNAITGSLSEQLSYNIEAALGLQIFGSLMQMFWRASGLMLIGMALFKWDILTAAKDELFYKKGLIGGLLFGIPLVVWGVVQNFNADWNLEYSMFLGSQFNYYGSLGLSFGYICAIMLFAKSKQLGNLKIRFASIGRMALTNYISQSIIGVAIFYGIGFGIFGQLERHEQLGIVLGIWVIQFSWSKPWLENFKFGPLEWIWRSLTYGKIQDIKTEK